ncbi:hypothetical protein [Arthrobacter agilis]|uniref:hypothetical protein n=1 Tax=Arthrobacter agilis TaxID=37921 RepID=UPI002786238B|nr:hypothetical protein [Arthrobacter agilis]MDQ0736670.1 hypothetical protein [Arthrobacter agilis]
MKKNVRTNHELEEGVALGLAAAAGVAAARDWATPHVDAAYGWAKPRWEKGLETAKPALQDTVRKATTGLAGGVAVVTPLIQESIDKVGPRITQVIDDTTPKIQETLDKATPVLNTAKGRVVDEYLPALSAKLGEAADTASRSLAAATVPPVVEKAVTRVTGDKKAARKAQKRLVAATMQASKDLRKNQSRSSGKGWPVFGIIAAAVVAAVAAWRASRPVQDPWKTPAPMKATAGPATTQKSQNAKDAVISIKEAADRAAASSGEVPAATATTNADAAPSASTPAKDTVKAKDTAKDTDGAKHAAEPTEDPKV